MTLGNDDDDDDDDDDVVVDDDDDDNDDGVDDDGDADYGGDGDERTWNTYLYITLSNDADDTGEFLDNDVTRSPFY